MGMFDFDDLETTKKASPKLKASVKKISKKLNVGVTTADTFKIDPRGRKRKAAVVSPFDVVEGMNVVEEEDIGAEDKLTVYKPAKELRQDTKPKVKVVVEEEDFYQPFSNQHKALVDARKVRQVTKDRPDRLDYNRMARPPERERVRKRAAAYVEENIKRIPGVEYEEDIAAQKERETQKAIEAAEAEAKEKKAVRRKELEKKLVKKAPVEDTPPWEESDEVESEEELTPKKRSRPKKEEPVAVVKKPSTKSVKKKAEDIGEDSRSSRKRARSVENDEDDDILITSDYPLKKIEPASIESLNAVFGDKSSAILELLDVGNSDGALSLTIKTLMHTLVNILPKVEGYVHSTNGQKGVYQLTQLIAQIRETCADIQAYRDKSNLGMAMVERYLRPSFLDIAAQIMQAWVQLETAASKNMSKEDAADFKATYAVPIRRSLSEYLTRKYEEIQTALVQSLN